MHSHIKFCNFNTSNNTSNLKNGCSHAISSFFQQSLFIMNNNPLSNMVFVLVLTTFTISVYVDWHNYYESRQKCLTLKVEGSRKVYLSFGTTMTETSIAIVTNQAGQFFVIFTFIGNFENVCKLNILYVACGNCLKWILIDLGRNKNKAIIWRMQTFF